MTQKRRKKRRFTEDVRSIPAREAPKEGQYARLTWPGVLAVLTRHGDLVTLRTAWEGGEGARRGSVRQAQLVALRGLRGRLRWLWQCPRCEKRVDAIYEVEAGEWACRTCGGLDHAAEGAPGSERALRRAAKIRRALGGTDDLSLPFPPRPERLKPGVYRALREEALRLEAVAAQSLRRVKGAHEVRRSRHVPKCYWPRIVMLRAA